MRLDSLRRLLSILLFLHFGCLTCQRDSLRSNSGPRRLPSFARGTGLHVPNDFCDTPSPWLTSLIARALIDEFEVEDIFIAQPFIGPENQGSRHRQVYRRYQALGTHSPLLSHRVRSYLVACEGFDPFEWARQVARPNLRQQPSARGKRPYLVPLPRIIRTFIISSSI